MAVGDVTDYARLRRDVGVSEALLPDATAELYFVEAAEMYPNSTAKMTAYTRVIALSGIRANSAMLGKYAQNESEEDLTKVFDNLTVMLKDWQARTAAATDPVTGTSSAFWFGTARGRRGQ